MAIDPKYKPIFTLVGLRKIANAIKNEDKRDSDQLLGYDNPNLNAENILYFLISQI